MSRRIFIAVFLALGCSSARADNRVEIALNSSWKFNLGDVPGASQTNFDDGAWIPVAVPHTWNNLDGQDGGNNYSRGIGWYRRHSFVDSSYTNRQLYLKFDGVNLVADVYVNGAFVGEHQGGFSAFAFDVTSNLVAGADNVIAVQVNNTNNAAIAPLSADFTFFGGLYRDVRLLVTDKLHVTPLDYGSPGVYLKPTNVTGASADLQVTTKIRNANAVPLSFTLTTLIVDAASNVVATLQTNETAGANAILDLVQTTTLSAPHLWNGRSDPYLYRVYTQLSDGAITNDVIQQPLGFRSFNVDANTGFHLNGAYLDLHGVNFHQDRLNKGWAISDADRLEDFGLINEIGATAVRLSHYQHSPTDYDLCDQSGIVAWSEIPLINSITTGTTFSNNAKTQLVEMIRQNYNHPSVCFWGIYNEVLLNAGPDPRLLVQQLHQLAKSEDATRLTTSASCCTGDNDAINWFTDLTGFNRYNGWYVNTYNDVGAAMDATHSFTNRPIALSEYGAGASVLQHLENPGKPADTVASPHYEEYQGLLHEAHWKQLATRPYIWGKFIWNIFDFASDGRAEGDTLGRNDKGLVTYDRQTRKDAFYWYKANWTANPVVYITSRRFTPRLSKTAEVKIYSNCDTVELRINGLTQGVLTSPDRIFKWTGRALRDGTNTLVAIGNPGTTDTVVWVVSPAINSGGYATGKFTADFAGGTVATTTNIIDTSLVTNSAPQSVYQSERYGNFTSTFTGLIAGGTYTARLHFAEFYWNSTGQRRFNVFLNGAQVLTNFDIIAAAGAANRAIIREFPVTATGGQIAVNYVTVTDNAKSSGIEIIGNTPPAITLNLPTGGLAYLPDTNPLLVLDATVTPAQLSWTKIGGPGAVTFGATNAANTTAAFSQTGTYVLRLTANDGSLQSSVDVTVVVNPGNVFASNAHYRFDEANGTIAADSSGNALNATAFVRWTNGFVNGSAGITNSVNAGHPSAFTTLFATGATVSAWINTATAGGNSLGRIFDKSAGGWVVFQNPLVDSLLHLQFEQAFTNSRTNKWRADAVMPTNIWTHVAVAYNASSSTNLPAIYVNGVVSTLTDVGSGPVNLANSALNDAAADLFIGNRAAGDRMFDGRIDDVRIYRRVLSAPEIFALVNLPTSSPPVTTTMFQVWQSAYFGCTNCPQAAAGADPDGDGLTNVEEFQAGSDPTDSSSALRIVAVTQEGPDMRITWRSFGGYTNVVQAGDLSGLSDLATNIIAGSGPVVVDYLDAGGATNAPARFYRVKVLP